MFRKKWMMWAVAALILVLITAAVIVENREEPAYLAYPAFLKAVDRGGIGEVTLGSGEKIKGKTATGETFTTDNPRSEDFKEMLLEKGVAVKEGGAGAQVSANLITGGILIGGMFLILRSRNKKTVSAIEAKNVAEAAPARPVTFQDVAGNEEAKRSMEELVEFLRDPAKFQRYGARMPRGVLFYGPPGTGKTLMARALAGEAGVAFYALSGSDFVQMYVGVGASRVRELFKKARGHGKCVIFIDEIDALGKKRQAGGDGGSDERDQTLNALLSEMSGFKGDEGIVVVAATNRADTLDEALLRPGRFDRHIEIGLPDLPARRRILQHYLEGKPVEDVDVDALARRCVYFSGAKLEYLVNEAAIAAAKRGGGRISMADLDQAYYRVLTGFEKLERDQIPLVDRRVTAVHEAGHALLTKLVSPESSVPRVSIIPSTGGMGGYSLRIPPERGLLRRVDLEHQMQILLAGRAAEALAFGEDGVTAGAENDLREASRLAAAYLGQLGMGDSLVYREGKEPLEKDMAALLEVQYQRAAALLKENGGRLARIARKLLEDEVLDESTLDGLIAA
ncbi:ATP-dependent metallopeptidase FtsH/Yme1/Tma family protein [Gehongia tenuis]